MNSGWGTRAETDGDVAAVRAINLAAFDSPMEADLVDALRGDPGWIDGLSVVSVDAEERPVGYALLTRGHIGDTPALGLGPVAVLPARQRRGAGSAAVRAALRAAQAQGERFVVVLGHRAYYPRFGFVRASTHGIRLGIDVPDEELMALTFDPADPPPAGTFRYATPFGV